MVVLIVDRQLKPNFPVCGQNRCVLCSDLRINDLQEFIDLLGRASYEARRVERRLNVDGCKSCVVFYHVGNRDWFHL